MQSKSYIFTNINLTEYTIFKIKLSKICILYIHVLILIAYIIVNYYLKNPLTNFEIDKHIDLKVSHIFTDCTLTYFR